MLSNGIIFNLKENRKTDRRNWYEYYYIKYYSSNLPVPTDIYASSCLKDDPFVSNATHPSRSKSEYYRKSFRYMEEINKK